jgi:hypothetical protein
MAGAARDSVGHTVIPELGMQRQEDHKFKVSLGYTASPCLKSENKTFLIRF